MFEMLLNWWLFISLSLQAILVKMKKTNITQNVPASVEVEMFIHVRLTGVMHLLRRDPDRLIWAIYSISSITRLFRGLTSTSHSFVNNYVFCSRNLSPQSAPCLRPICSLCAISTADWGLLWRQNIWGVVCGLLGDWFPHAEEGWSGSGGLVQSATIVCFCSCCVSPSSHMDNPQAFLWVYEGLAVACGPLREEAGSERESCHCCSGAPPPLY